MTYGFLGGGNMASAIIAGMISNGYSPSDIFVFDISDKAANAIVDASGVNKSQNANALTASCDYVFIAVKPQSAPQLFAEIKESVRQKEPVVISIMAGFTTQKIVELLGHTPKLIRIMPNINAKIGQSITAVCSLDTVNEDEYIKAADIFLTFGRLLPIPEDQFPIFTALASNSPAFTYLFIDSMARAAVKLGMKKSLATEIAAAAVSGSANMLLAENAHPHELIDRVTSPGGTTIEGLCELNANGFETAVTRALVACVEKDKQLSLK